MLLAIKYSSILFYKKNLHLTKHYLCCRGKFAAVRRCTHRATGVAYAAKCIRKRRRLQDQRADILHEVAVLLTSSSSSRIVRLCEVYETSNEIAIVLEL